MKLIKLFEEYFNCQNKFDIKNFKQQVCSYDKMKDQVEASNDIYIKFKYNITQYREDNNTYEFYYLPWQGNKISYLEYTGDKEIISFPFQGCYFAAFYGKDPFNEMKKTMIAHIHTGENSKIQTWNDNVEKYFGTIIQPIKNNSLCIFDPTCTTFYTIEFEEENGFNSTESKIKKIHYDKGTDNLQI